MSAVPVPDNSLLAQPPSVRLQYFKDFAVAHTLLVEAKDRLLDGVLSARLRSAEPGDLVQKQ